MENLNRQINKKAVVIGTGGFAIELSGLLVDEGWGIEGFIGPEPVRKLPSKWLGDDSIIEKISKEVYLFVAVGSTEIRKKVVDKIAQNMLQPSTFVHSKAYVSQQAIIEDGCIVYPNATIHSGVTLKQNVLVNSNATIGHETVVEEFSNIGPGASIGGYCQLGKMTYVGIGASIIENLTVRNEVFLGAGATLVTNADKSGVYIGVPAKLKNI